MVGPRCRCMHDGQMTGWSAWCSMAYGTIQLTYSSKQGKQTRGFFSLEGRSMSTFLTLEESLSACWVVVNLWCLCCHVPKPFLDNPAKYFCNTAITATQHVTNTHKNRILKNSTWQKMPRGILACGCFLAVFAKLRILDASSWQCSFERRTLWSRIVVASIVYFCKYT